MAFNKGLIVAMLLVTAVFAVFGSLLLNVGSIYDVTVEAEYEETFISYQETNTLVQSLDSTIEGGEVNPEGLGESVYTNVVVAGKTSRQVGALAQNLIMTIPNIIGIPAILLTIIVTIIFTLITFGFIGMIARRSP